MRVIDAMSRTTRAASLAHAGPAQGARRSARPARQDAPQSPAAPPTALSRHSDNGQGQLLSSIDVRWWLSKLTRMNTFDQLTGATRAALAEIGQVRSWHDGDVLQRAGEPAAALLLVRRGRLRLCATSASGAEMQWPVVGPGKLVCLYSAVGGLPFHFTTIACGDCTVVHFETGRLLALMERNAPVACDIAKLLARRFWGLMDERVEGHQASVAHRVYAVLRYMAAQRGVPRPHGNEVRISQQELATMVGSSRPHLNTCLRQLQQGNLIEIGYRSILVRELPAEPD